jgi:peptidoglycan biosynthesis protein MviN/MurJ (putative lipid II flippase)
LLVSSAVGAAVGAVLEGTLDTRLLALIAALAGTVIASLIRYMFLYRLSGTGPDEARIPSVMVVNSLIAAIAGGLAAHDLVTYLEIRSEVFLGIMAGLAAGILMAMLMITYHYSPSRD